MRHIPRALTALALATTLLAASACGGDSGGAASSSDGGKVTLRFTWWGSDTRTKLTQQVIDAYQKDHPNVTIKGEFGEWSGYWDKLATTVAANDAPDIIQMDEKYLREYADRGALLDLKKAEGLDTGKFEPDTLGAGEFDGGLYGLNAGINSFAVVVNPAAFKTAGVPIPDDKTWTWDDFADFNEQITAATGGATYGTGFYVPWTPTISIWARQHGEQLYNEDGSLGISEKTLADYWKMTTDLRDAGGFAPAGSLEDSGSSTAESPLGKDFIASQIIPANTFADYNSAMDGDLALLRVPGEGQWGEKGYQVTPTLQWGMAAKSDHPEEAAALIDLADSTGQCNGSCEMRRKLITGGSGCRASMVISAGSRSSWRCACTRRAGGWSTSRVRSGAVRRWSGSWSAPADTWRPSRSGGSPVRAV
jgi:multiple sugar transport system substrate-binding protein